LQFGRLVIGVEGDADWSGQSSSGTAFDSTIPWLATARARVGYAYDRIQLYGTGGAGYVQFANGVTSVAGIAPVASRRTAWAAGLGSESAATPNVLLRFEVLYLQLFGNADTPAGATPVPSSERVYDILIRAGLSYKFGWPGN
jgi:outer membrane immunogenic protein